MEDWSLEDIDADTRSLGGEVWRVAGGHRYMEAERRGMEGCWRTQIHGGWEVEGGRVAGGHREVEGGRVAGGHRYMEAGR